MAAWCGHAPPWGGTERPYRAGPGDSPTRETLDALTDAKRCQRKVCGGVEAIEFWNKYDWMSGSATFTPVCARAQERKRPFALARHCKYADACNAVP